MRNEDVEQAEIMSETSDCSSSSSSSNSNSTSTEVAGRNEDALKKELAARETKAVFWLRVLVIVSLLVAALGVSLAVYYIARDAEVEEFVTNYEGSSEKILQAFRKIVEQKLVAVGSIEVAAIAETLYHDDSEWPFFTLPAWQERAATARSGSGSLFLSINPIVNETNRARWEEFVGGEDSEWIETGLAYQEDLRLNEFERVTNDVAVVSTVQKEIFVVNEDEQAMPDPGPGPYLPAWLSSPVLRTNNVNQNLFKSSLHGEAIKNCLESQAVVIGRFNNAPPGDFSTTLDPKTAFYSTLLSIAANKTVSYQGDPMSRIYFPIFSSFDDNRQTVAVMIDVVNWASYFNDVLPPNVQGVIAVLENPCDGAYTYEINGDDVLFLGPGDRHDPLFDYMERTASFQEIIKVADGTRLGLDLKKDYCPMQLRVYPSQEYYDNYITALPYTLTISVAMIFLFTATMFVLYDSLVKRRQRLLWTRATQSTRIVSSLFPRKVRDRLMEESSPVSRRDSVSSATRRFKSFMTNEASSDLNRQDETEYLKEPIAELFPSATVIFADIAGFTSWSASREPTQVFTLLQTLYHAFDALATKHGVFKIETIGDSYVGVAGLPDPQENHAQIAAEFASACLLEMDELTEELEPTLGDGTSGLSMRFGLNSGPVTAGVLRGDRCRYQIFGDTVNLASRMESTGQRGRIQVSKATADLITQAGKGDWVQARPEPVNAKGKGVLNTFFVSPS